MSNDPNEDPALAISTDEIDERIGRLYHRPEFTLPETLDLNTIKELVSSGDLVPSTTNVISVESSPYLLPWASRVVARDTVEMALTNPNFFSRIRANKFGAIDFFKNAPIRERDHWGNQGSKVHLAVELLAKGKDISHLELTDYESKCVDEWKRWFDIFQPELEHLEVTGFGKTEDNLGYGKTTDFIGKFAGRRFIGDYKCVVDDTPILLPTGATVEASKLQVGDEVVAWTKDKNLHTSKVSFVGDNGFHKTVTITTGSGQKITTTLNHPFWSSRNSRGLGWVKAEDIHIGDEVYIGLGWNYSPQRQEIEWPYKKNLSPYLLGMLWTLRNYSRQNFRTEHLIDLPPIARGGLKDELNEIGFIFNKAGQLNTRKGFAKIARKNKIEIDDLLDLIDTPELPDFVYGADKNHIAAFIAGVKEVFANREIYADELVLVFNNAKALSNLQQFFLNYGQPATIQKDHKMNLSYMKVPYESTDTIYAYGPTASKVTSLEVHEEPEHTIAIEVEGSHTHITAGIITHNTNRSGAHASVALQLAANSRVDVLSPNNEDLIPNLEVEGGLVVHISPKGVNMQEVDISQPVWDSFQSLRRVWDWHAFDGKLLDKKGVFMRKIKSLKDF